MPLLGPGTKVTDRKSPVTGRKSLVTGRKKSLVTGRKKSIHPASAATSKTAIETDVEKGPDVQPPDAAEPAPKSVKDKEEKEHEKGGADEEKIKYDPEDDVWTLDEGKPSPGRKYARSAMEAFRPLLGFAALFGLFPLVPVRNNTDGIYTIKYSWHLYYFLFIGTFVVGSTIWMIVSVVLITVNVPEHSRLGRKPGDLFRSEEIWVYKRNVLTLVIMICSFLNLTICMITVFHRRDYIEKQLIYWTTVVELLQLDVGHRVARKLWRHLIVIFLFMASIIALYTLGQSPFLSGSGSTFYIVMARLVTSHSHWHYGMDVRRAVFAGFLLFSILAGFIYALWFFYNCRILINILRIWNNRFQYCLHKQVLEQSKGKNTDTRTSHRTTRAQLFQDHLVIFNLLEGVNAQFAIIMESFYLTTMVMIVFESYGLVHAIFYDEFIKCGRRFDIFPMAMFLAMHGYIYIVITLEAAGVADEARHVLDIVRRKGMMGSKNDSELWFMLSMRLSFGGHEDVGIIGAGYFYITKSFLLGAISALTSHFIIFFQFEIPFQQTAEADENVLSKDWNRTIRKLIKQLEGSQHDSTC